MADNTSNITVGVGFNVDQTQFNDIIKQVNSIGDAMSRGMSDSLSESSKLLSDLAKVSSTMGQVMNMAKNIEHASAAFGRRLDETSRKELEVARKKAKEYEKMAKELRDVAEKSSKTSDPSRKAEYGRQMEQLMKSLDKLGKDMRLNDKTLKKLTKQYDKMSRRYGNLKDVVDNTSVSKTISESFKKLDLGNLSSMSPEKLGGFMKSAAEGSAKNIIKMMGKGKVNKVEAAGGIETTEGAAAAGEMSGAIEALGTAVAGLSAGVALFAVFVKLVADASESMTKLNKALVEGHGFARDMNGTAQDYSKSLENIRSATIAINSELGATFQQQSADVMKTVKSYMDKTSSSLHGVSDAMEEIGRGKGQEALERGIKSFYTKAASYGMALGKSAQDVAAMMGSFETSMGLSHKSVDKLMKKVVIFARDARMPMENFMDIFKNVIPSVDLYRNRLDELTATIVNLSRNMSPDAVKQFMDAFANGFKGQSFMERLHTVFTAGPKNVQSALTEDVKLKAQHISNDIKELIKGKKGDQFAVALKKAIESGNAKRTRDVIAQIQDSTNGKLNGAMIEKATKATYYAKNVASGSPLNMATAMKDTGMYGMYKILEKKAGNFGVNIENIAGLNEHVLDKLGINKQMQEALQNFRRSVLQYKENISTAGTTGSKSLNEMILKVMKDRGAKNIDLSKATVDDITKATSMSQQDLTERQQRAAAEAKDFSREQTNALNSIMDMIKNQITYMLEKMYGVLNQIAEWAKGIFSWFSSDKSKQEEMRNQKKSLDDYFGGIKNAVGGDQNAIRRAESIKSSLTDDINSGMSKDEILFKHRGIIKKSIASKSDEELLKDYNRLRKSKGETLLKNTKEMNRKGAIKELNKSIDSGNEDVLGKVYNAGDLLNMYMYDKNGLTPDMAEKLKDRTTFKRPGAKSIKEHEKGPEGLGKGSDRDDSDWRGTGTGLDEITKAKSATGSATVTQKELKTQSVSGGALNAQPATQSRAEETGKKSLEESKKTKKINEKQEKHLKKTQDAMVSLNKNINKIMYSSVYAAVSKALQEYLVMKLAAEDENSPIRTYINENFEALQTDPTYKGWYKSANQAMSKPKDSKDGGGIIPETGLYKLNKGEKVITQMGAGYGQSNNVNVTIHVNGAQDPTEVSRQIKSTLLNISSKGN